MIRYLLLLVFLVTAFRLGTLPAAAGEVYVVRKEGVWKADAYKSPPEWVLVVSFNADDVLLIGFEDAPRPQPPTPPDGSALETRVELWADQVNEKRAASAQAITFGFLVEQAKKGRFRSKSSLASFTKLAITQALEQTSSKVATWQAVYDQKIWPAVRTIESTGRMNTLTDQIRVWSEIQRGFEGSGGAQEVGIWDFLLKLLMDWLLEWLGGL